MKNRVPGGGGGAPVGGSVASASDAIESMIKLTQSICDPEHRLAFTPQPQSTPCSGPRSPYLAHACTVLSAVFGSPWAVSVAEPTKLSTTATTFTCERAKCGSARLDEQR